jgi:hypothetical protein
MFRNSYFNVSTIPSGLIDPRGIVPNVETLGYCHLSLWDRTEPRMGDLTSQFK